MKVYITITDLIQNYNFNWLEDKEQNDFNLIMSKILTKLNLNDFSLTEINNELELVFNIDYLNVILDYFKVFNAYTVNDIEKENELNYYLNQLELDYWL